MTRIAAGAVLGLGLGCILLWAYEALTAWPVQ